MMHSKKSKTSRGFSLFEFTDFNGEKCSLQKSSIATEDCIWLGVDDAKPMILVHGKGWVKLPRDPEVQYTTRMHLDRDRAREIGEALIRFAETGEV